MMRLLNVDTLKLEERNNQLYAILSHTWGDEEATFEDLETKDGKRKAGYQKIQKTCEIAKQDGFQYVWIDTCCVDKRSSSELSESINSMFEWYQRSARCYVFFSDIIEEEDLSSARWFTRGWTLQELLAPEELMFYDRNWSLLGSMSHLASRISTITGISKDLLNLRDNSKDIQLISLAERMSWASQRTTTREEDIAYCLLGLFEVNMPLLYGEGGTKAFQRLQEIILQNSTDHSLLAWQRQPDSPITFLEAGALARHPRDFKSGNSILPTGKQVNSFSLNNNGLQIRLPIYRRAGLRRNRHVAVLECFSSSLTGYIGIPLKSLEREGRVFVREPRIIDVSAIAFKTAQIKDICILRNPPDRRNPILWMRSSPVRYNSFKVSEFFASEGSWDVSRATIGIHYSSQRLARMIYAVVLKGISSHFHGRRLAVIIHIDSEQRYSANVTIREPSDSHSDSPGIVLKSLLRNADVSSIGTHTAEMKLGHEMELTASIAWETISSRETLVLDIDIVLTSLIDRLKERLSSFWLEDLTFGILMISSSRCPYENLHTFNSGDFWMSNFLSIIIPFVAPITYLSWLNADVLFQYLLSGITVLLVVFFYTITIQEQPEYIFSWPVILATMILFEKFYSYYR